MPPKCGVYEIACSNGFAYYGRSINVTERLYSHKRRLITKKHHCIEMQKDFNKFGVAAFEFSIIKTTKNYKQACMIEQNLVRNGIKSKKCYNKLPIVSIISKPLSSTQRIVTYLEADLLKWITLQVKKLRISESAFIRQSLAEKMKASRD